MSIVEKSHHLLRTSSSISVPMHPSWGLSLDQTIDLLKWRCKLIGYDEDVDVEGIRLGVPQACLRILRFVFCNFSEALTEHLELHELDFEEDMEEEEFVEKVLCAWEHVSPQALLGSITTEKVLASGNWINDRLLFTLQCIFVCTEKHTELVKANLEAATSPSWWDITEIANDEPRKVVAGSQHNDVFEWMKEVYKQQLDTANHPEKVGEAAAQQAAWIAAIRGEESDGAECSSFTGSIADTCCTTTYDQDIVHQLGMEETSQCNTKPSSARKILQSEPILQFRDSHLDTPFIA